MSLWRSAKPNANADDVVKRAYVLEVCKRYRTTRAELVKICDLKMRDIHYWIKGKKCMTPNVINAGVVLYSWARDRDDRIGILINNDEHKKLKQTSELEPIMLDFDI